MSTGFTNQMSPPSHFGGSMLGSGQSSQFGNSGVSLAQKFLAMKTRN
jgi:hypothetical protein